MDENGSLPTIGFIGVGFMGHGMAKNIRKAGYPLIIKGNRNRQPVENLLSMGASEAKSPADMAGSCEIIHLCLSNSSQVETVFRGPDGILSAAREGLIVIDTTTSDPVSTVALAAELSARGGTLVDAPLGRTPAEAEAGTLDAMVGAEEEIFARVLPVIETWAGNINRIGPVASAHRMKLIMNFISMGYAALYAEALSLGAAVQVPPETVRKVIGSSRLSNGFFESFMRYAVDRDRDAHKFTLENAHKDMRYAAGMAADAGVTNIMGAAIKHYFSLAEGMGRGQDYVPMISDLAAEMNGLDPETMRRKTE